MVGGHRARLEGKCTLWRSRPLTAGAVCAVVAVLFVTLTKAFTCTGCSGGKKVGDIGRDTGVLRFNGVAATSGPITVTFAYVNGADTRTAQLRVDDADPVWLSFPGTGGWSTVGTLDVIVTARSGSNSLTLFNTDGPAPDFDRITVTVPGS